ncbi:MULTISPECIES: XdhC family protein [unclassified Brevibacterium]
MRVDVLNVAVVPVELMKRLYAPIGLDLGAETPQEATISIKSEVIRR